MSAFNEQFMSHVNIATYAITSMDTDTKNNILTKYDILASSDNADLQQNMSNYEVLMNKTLFMSTVMSTNASELERFSNLITLLRRSIANTTSNKYDYKAVYNKLASKLEGNGAGISNIVTLDSIDVALNTFGLEVADNLDTEEITIESDLDSIDMESLFDEEDESLVEITGEADDIDAIDAVDLLEDTVDISDDNADNVSDTDSNRGEIRKKLEEKFGVDVNGRIRTLLETFDDLYKSGFESMPQAGVLIRGNSGDSPLISIKSNSASGSGYGAVSTGDGGTISDVRILDVILNNIPELSKYSGGENGKVIPSIDKLMNDNMVCYELHLQFQSANIKYCTGRNSIRKWITETQLEKSGCANFDEWIKKKNNGGTVRLSKYSDVRKWYKWSLENMIYDALIDAGVQPSYEYAQLENQVIESLYKNFKNAIIVAERNVGIKTEIRISTNSIIDKEKLINNLESALNVGNDRTIKVKLLINNNPSILKFNVVFNPAEENKANLFASEVLSNILSSGNAPTWSHALLGKNEDGTYLFWDDFMDPAKAGPSKRCYTIYAASRSGKGIMTSTLVASALCDKKQVFYTDGKPENGACLGEIAWSRGKEAYVFNGTPDGAVPYGGAMEQYTSGMRSENEIYDFATKLPKSLFESSIFTKSDQRKFFGVMRYLKSMLLCSEVVIGRAKGTLAKDEWQVWIFDEMTKMSNNEKDIRKKFLQYAGDKVKVKKIADSDKTEYLVSITNDDKLKKALDKNSDTYDEGIDYIYRWLHWNDCIKSNMHSAAVIELGKADMNLIFIFQQASWIPEDSNITTIGAVVDDLDSTKIVGRGGIQPLCKNYGDGTTKGPWRDKVESGTGWWAISNDSDIRNGNVKLFKPFNVFTTKLGSDGLKSTEGFTSQEEAEHYLDGYVRSLLGNFGINPEDILNNAFEYANNAILTLGYASNLKEFIYDYSNLVTGNSANKLEDVGNDDGALVNSNGVTSSVHFDSDFNDSVNSVDNQNGQNIQDDFLRQVQQQKADAEQMKTLKFMRTNVLIRTNLSDNVLATYINKFIWNRARQNSFNYSDRSNTMTSLTGAAITYSTLHYAGANRGIVDLDIIKNEFIQNIQSNNDQNHKAKLALGMLSAYDTNTLQYDQLPSQDIMRQWISEYDQIVDNTISNMNIPYNVGTDMQGEQFTQDVQNSRPIDVWSPDFEEDFINYGTAEPTREEILRDGARTVNVEQFNPNIFYSNVNGVRQFTPKVTQNVTVLNPSTFREVEMKSYKTTERFKKRLFESKNGTAYIFKKYWDAILDESVKLVGNRSRVTKMAVMGNQLTINGMIVDISRLLDETYGLTLNNLFHIKSTFKKFPMLQQLILDSDASSHLIFEYGDNANAVWKMFQDNRALQTVIIIGYDGNAVNYNRRDFAATANVLNNQLSIKKFSMEAEQAVAQKNPRLHSKPVGYMYGVFNNGKTLSGNSFKKAGKYFTDKDPKLLRAMGWSTVGLAAIGVGSVIGLAGGIVDLFTPKK